MIVQSKNIFIRKITLKDVSKNYLNWFRDPAIKENIINKKYQNLDDLKKYVTAHLKKKNEIFLGIFLKNNKHIGNIKFENINLTDKTAHVGIMIGDKRWRGKGIATEALELSINWIYKNFQIKKIFLGVNKNNIFAIKVYKKCGFRIIKEKNNNYIMVNEKNLLNLSRLSIGTAQFGMNYGITNQSGKINFSECKKIIKLAEKNGIFTVDTAPKYGDAEKILGKIGVNRWNVTTKLPPTTEFQNFSKKYDVNQIVRNSLKRLKIKSLYGLLIHSSYDFKNNGSKIIKKLKKLKKNGKIKKIGISITNFEDLKFVLKKLPIDIIQIPFNIFDQRLKNSGMLNTLIAKGIEIHIRSIFLQGLILQNAKQLPQQFIHWKNSWEKLENFTKKKKNFKDRFMFKFFFV